MLWIAPGFHIKKGLIATERDRPALRQARREWITRRQPGMRQEPHRLVFIDETAVKTNLTRLRGPAPVGARLYGHRTLRQMGNTDVHRRADTKRADCALGYHWRDERPGIRHLC